MTKAEMEGRTKEIEKYLSENSDLTLSRMYFLAGEWEGLNKAINFHWYNSESALSMLWRTRGV